MNLNKGCKPKEKRRSVVRDLRISEVSSVGRGANEGAHVALLKTADTEDANIEGSSNAARDKRDRQNVDPKLLKSREEIMEKLQTELDELKARYQEQADKLTKSEMVASLNDAQKDYYAGLDGEAKEAFEKMSSEERDQLIEKAAAADEAIEVNGKEIRKSECGVETFEILKAAEAEKDELKKALEAEKDELKKALEAKEAEAIQKKLEGDAEKEFPHLGGSIAKKAELLKLARKDKEIMEVLKGADASAGSLMVEKGVSDAASVNNSDDPNVMLQKMAKKLADEQHIDRATAMAKVLDTKEGADLYGKTCKKN